MTLKYFVKEKKWSTFAPGGWGNGYVCLPEKHPCFGMHYDEIHSRYDIEVNGCLTFSDHSGNLDWEEIPEGIWWIVGFDTAHYWDSIEKWPDSESVEQETIKLFNQLTIL